MKNHTIEGGIEGVLHHLEVFCTIVLHHLEGMVDNLSALTKGFCSNHLKNAHDTAFSPSKF